MNLKDKCAWRSILQVPEVIRDLKKDCICYACDGYRIDCESYFPLSKLGDIINDQG